MKYILYFGYILIVFGTLLIIITYIKDLLKKKTVLKKNNSFNYAIIIPARYESNVIKGLLESIKKQTSLNNTYVIIEDKKDETYNITLSYGANVFIRKVKDSTKRKGYALDECLKDIIKKGVKYDLYFIFDADNVLDDNYFNEMLKVYSEGYSIACGYRSIKNNNNVISICSGLVFTMINNIVNKWKSKFNRGIIVSGTGFYIDGKIIDKLNGYPFYSLTEDYELSLYCEQNNISSTYCESAIFYDAQPTDMKTSIIQRSRWIKGFFNSRKIQLKSNNDSFGVLPVIIILLGIIINVLASIYKIIYSISNNQAIFYKHIINFVLLLLFVYIVLIVFTLFILLIDNNRININKKDFVKVILFNPIFLLTFINSLFKAIFNKNMKWDVIKH
jgi:cellulose synthase/poly-beta-1,6-N-acetylglucosamine synthase-like glycosyltransferase